MLPVTLCLYLALSFTGQGAAAQSYKAEPIHPIPTTTDEDPQEVELGRRLFSEPRLSADNSVACASCHPLDQAGTDGLPVSVGINGARGKVNTLTVFNSALHVAQFWDGRAETLEDQAEGPVHNPIEMGSNWQEVIDKLNQDPDYVDLFREIYDKPISAESIKKAIAAFERTLLTPNSRFDFFLRGHKAAITEEERNGYLLFKSYGCASCHQGVAVGGNMYEKMGLFGNYFAERGNVTRSDLGRFNVTGDEEQKFEFKVPSLRNVTLTAPYFHDGSAETLEEAVVIMARYQLGRTMPDHDRKKIVAFLNTLVGEFPEGEDE